MALLLAVLLTVPPAWVAAQTAAGTGFNTRARAAWVFDHSAGMVLMAKNADVPIPPASMSKLMTLDLIFEALRDGRVSLDDTFRVSAKAHAMGGSKMFLREGERVSLRNLIHGIIVDSGNDACITVAEGLAGTEAAFVKQMNDRAKALGMTNSSFGNATGWPNPKQRMSVRDLGFLARRMITEFPQYYPFFSVKQFTWSGITQKNRDPLLGVIPGADGLKTGHTQESGYGLVGSAKQGGRRVTFVVAGLDSVRARAQEGERVLNWAFRQFSQKTIATKGTVIAEANVWLGATPRVGLALPKDLTLLLPAMVQDNGLKAEVDYSGPLHAPIKKGQKVATLVIEMPGFAPIRRPLVAARAVARGGVSVRMRAAAIILLRQLAGKVQALN